MTQPFRWIGGCKKALLQPQSRVFFQTSLFHWLCILGHYPTATELIFASIAQAHLRKTR